MNPITSSSNGNIKKKIEIFFFCFVQISVIFVRFREAKKFNLVFQVNPLLLDSYCKNTHKNS